ncbi:hypothetical protein T1J70_08640 [Lactiplantibacillus plantarum]|nr:hypothetical protein TUW04_02575 [Lactiplantibacillus plantarum]WQG53984.1 hypothetical protein T1J70_08640 [Lactiplantibacillus plantarum]
MNPEDMFQRYLNKYQITYQHPEHGLVMLTSLSGPNIPSSSRPFKALFKA